MTQDSAQKISSDLNNLFKYFTNSGHNMIQVYVLSRVATEIARHDLNADVVDKADRDVDRVIDNLHISVIEGQDTKTATLQMRGYYCEYCSKFFVEDVKEKHNETCEGNKEQVRKVVLTLREW